MSSRILPISEGTRPFQAERNTPEPSIITKILVPIDFSPRSRATLAVAVSLSQSAHADIHLMHVLEPPPVTMDYMPLILSDEEVAARCQKDIQELCAQYAKLGIRVDSEVALGLPSVEIARAATRKHCDLLVISTHGYTGLKHLLLGSTAEKVIRAARCPVLVMRTPETEPAAEMPLLSDFKPKRILAPTDFSPRSVESVRYAAEFARLFGAEITLMHSIHLPATSVSHAYAAYDLAVLTGLLGDNARRDLGKLRETAPTEIVHDTVVAFGPPLGEVPRIAKEGNYDLIICSTHGYSGIKHALLGSTAEGIVRYAPCPVLIVGERAARERGGGKVEPAPWLSHREPR